MKYLIDTNVISELVAKKPNINVVRWIDGIDPLDIFISVLTIGEIKKGVEKLTDPAKKERLNQWLESDLPARFKDRILTVDLDVMIQWGLLYTRLESIGKPMPAIDSLLVATAIHHNCCIVTRNTEDFKESDVKLLNPWVVDCL